MNIGVYTVVDVRTDFISYQARTIEKFSLEHTGLTVLDNTPPGRAALRPEIQAQCSAGKAAYVKVPDAAQNHDTANEAHAYALEWAWQNLILKDRYPYVMLLDFDAFFVAPFAMSTYLAEAEVAGWPQGAGGAFYIWPGLMLIALERLPAPETISLNCGRVDGAPVDVGGQFHHYLKAHPEVRVRVVPSSNRAFDRTVACLPEGAREEYRSYMESGGFTRGVDIFDGMFLHYVGGTGWDYPPPDFTARKTAWLFNLLEKLLSGEWVMP